jgi:cytochrome c2
MRNSVVGAVAILGFALGQLAVADDLDQRLAAANPKRGQLLFMVCKACHDLEPGVQPPKAGPALNGIFGRKAGTEPGFKYTDAMAKSGVVWTPQTLDTFLKQPGAMVPGNGMAFPGVANDADRASLIVYLQSSSAPR